VQFKLLDPKVTSGNPWTAYDLLPPGKADARNWSDKHIAIVIHGLFNSIDNMNDLAYYLAALRSPVSGRKYYDAVWGVDYKYTAHIGDTGQLVAEFLDARLRGTGRKVDVFGYSMGGLVARSAIERAKLNDGTTGCAAYVGRLFTLATPHNGVPGRAIATATIACARNGLVLGGVLLADVEINLAQPGIRDLINPGSYLSDLNGSTVPASHGSTDYYTVGGNHWYGWHGTGYASLGAFMHTWYSVSGADANMDGIVEVSSAQFSGLDLRCRNWIRVPDYYNLNHSDMRGVGVGSAFNLDADPRPYGSDDHVGSAYQTPPHPHLRDWILPGGVDVIVQ
jgi:pimeloyl-ACP methyl ester carboxylesterase